MHEYIYNHIIGAVQNKQPSFLKQVIKMVTLYPNHLGELD